MCWRGHNVLDGVVRRWNVQDDNPVGANGYDDEFRAAGAIRSHHVLAHFRWDVMVPVQQVPVGALPHMDPRQVRGQHCKSFAHDISLDTLAVVGNRLRLLLVTVFWGRTQATATRTETTA